VCRKIRSQLKTRRIPILFLTAKGEEVDRIVGLELGGDDYMVKPFSPRELVLRVKAILRRHGPETGLPQNVLTAGPLMVDKDRHQVTVNKKEATLTSMEFKLLVVLLERRGRMQSRERLLSDVWDVDAEVTTRTVDTHIKRLRQKLGVMGRHIETVRGYGYRFAENPEALS
jgi:DNA-binding response OmpR family regulator